MSEHDPERDPTDFDLDLEAPNEGATGDNAELDDEELAELADDDGYADDDEDF